MSYTRVVIEDEKLRVVVDLKNREIRLCGFGYENMTVVCVNSGIPGVVGPDISFKVEEPLNDIRKSMLDKASI